LTRPLVAAGARLSQSADRNAGATGAMVLPSLLLGGATGLLWAPCAGPVLGLILTGAAIEGVSVETSLLLFAYAAGAATSLALALLVGGRVFAAMKRSLGAGEWIRRGLGAAVLAAVAVIMSGLDTGLLRSASLASTTALEEGLLERLHLSSSRAETAPPSPTRAQREVARDKLPVEGRSPSLSGATAWLNSPPLTAGDLKGKVVLINFWTYSCINCLRAIPYVRAWAERYKDQGLVVIGVHAPEFAFEKTVGNVRKAIADHRIGYPVAIDNDFAIWRAFNNRYWPAQYFIDGQGRIRHHQFGEGAYDESERAIQQLLAQTGDTEPPAGLVQISPAGAEAAPDMDNIRSPETYVGYEQAANFVSPGGARRNARHVYTAGMPRLNEWGLSGDWTVGGEHAVLNAADGAIVYRFHARDLHLVLGPTAEGRAIRFRVTIDGAAPGDSHGTDVDADGHGAVTRQRLHQLVRQSGAITDRTFEIRFLDPGVEAYVFTFG
jgi:thiol-disulfide isomerase/thioredoxin